MRSIELNMFIDSPKSEVYNQLAEPINMIGLQPLLTTIDILKEQKNSEGTLLRPFYMVETYWLLGLPVYRTRVYTVISLTKPGDKLELRMYRKLGIVLANLYEVQSIKEEGTHLIQKIQYEKGPGFLENPVFEQAVRAQRALLTNLKVRLEKR